jgi:hypothetical protein
MKRRSTPLVLTTLTPHPREAARQHTALQVLVEVPCLEVLWDLSSELRGRGIDPAPRRVYTIATTGYVANEAAAEKLGDESRLPAVGSSISLPMIGPTYRGVGPSNEAELTRATCDRRGHGARQQRSE